jgi:cell shape-determining protein MreD
MIAFNSMLILIAAFAAVFLQSAINGVLGVQIDLLPSLMVYAALTAGPLTIATLALCGGLWFDSLSANPLGLSVLPLAGIGAFILTRRDLILRQQTFAQFVIGLAASFAAPAVALLGMLTFGHAPLLGWGTLWQFLLMTLAGGAATPGLFWFFDRLTNTFDYKEAPSSSFRPDREIRRGRN